MNRRPHSRVIVHPHQHAGCSNNTHQIAFIRTHVEINCGLYRWIGRCERDCAGGERIIYPYHRRAYPITKWMPCGFICRHNEHVAGPAPLDPGGVAHARNHLTAHTLRKSCRTLHMRRWKLQDAPSNSDLPQLDRRLHRCQDLINAPPARSPTASGSQVNAERHCRQSPDLR